MKNVIIKKWGDWEHTVTDCGIRIAIDDFLEKNAIRVDISVSCMTYSYISEEVNSRHILKTGYSLGLMRACNTSYGVSVIRIDDQSQLTKPIIPENSNEYYFQTGVMPEIHNN